MCLSFVPGRLILHYLLATVITGVPKPADTNTSTRKISPLNYFVLGKNSPAYRTNTHLQTYEAISTCPRIFGMDS